MIPQVARGVVRDLATQAASRKGSQKDSISNSQRKGRGKVRPNLSRRSRPKLSAHAPRRTRMTARRRSGGRRKTWSLNRRLYMTNRHICVSVSSRCCITAKRWTQNTVIVLCRLMALKKLSKLIRPRETAQNSVH